MKIKCSVELPIKNLDMSDHFDYDFVIASTCFEHKEYRDYFMACPNRFMILDNGAFETGESVDDRKYLELAAELKPNVIVIPDVLYDPVATLDRFFEFMNIWKENANDFKGTELMGVIQCNGNYDTAHMMSVVYNSHGVECIGVPYASMIDRYKFISQHPELTNVHILGCPTVPEVMSLQLLDNVKSIDSSLPVKVTSDGMYLSNKMASQSYVKPTYDKLDKQTLSYNLDLFTSICHDECVIVRK